jgi:hypothetical protein
MLVACHILFVEFLSFFVLYYEPLFQLAQSKKKTTAIEIPQRQRPLARKSSTN